MRTDVRAVAFYLPQFHPIPENDEWWGPGFTEWTNTARATPLYPRHRQPNLPTELGFYDLRVPESRAQQAELAAASGISAFCYWHYWFGGGRRILTEVFEAVLQRGEPEIAFCLGWANQSWTGTWHGAADRVLIEQRYPGAEDEEAHFDAVLPALRDPRYLRVEGKPVFYVFRPEELPDAAGFVAHWRRLAARAGLPGLYLVAEVSDLLGRGPRYTRVSEDGFDAGVYIRLPAELTPWSSLRMRVLLKLGLPEIYPYARAPIAAPAGHHPAIYPNWDNTPRAGRRGLVLHGAEPEAFRAHVRAAVAQARALPEGERFVWVKSWNEWAEGNYLEPDRRFGRGWLDVLAAELGQP